MPKRTEFQELTVLRLNEATTLLAHNYPNGAFYLAGYAVECALKSAICRTLNIDDFFEPNTTKSHSAKVKEEVLQKFRTHDYGTLLALSGLYYKLNAALQTDSLLDDSWSTIQSQAWSEQYRYEVNAKKTVADVAVFIDSVKYLLQWIKQHW